LIHSQVGLTSKPTSITAHSLAEFSAAGSTIVLKQIDLFDKEMHEACTLLSRQRRAPVHANVYYTPAGCEGYLAHFDFHDTIIWQICGAKHWRLWSPPVAVEERINAKPVIDRARRRRRKSKLVLETGFALEIPAGLGSGPIKYLADQMIGRFTGGARRRRDG
jgi:ribosomal protein L16 Arg81 hydroxylase